MKRPPLRSLSLQIAFCQTCLLQAFFAQALFPQNNIAQNQQSAFPELYNSETAEDVLLSPLAALESLHLPAGFTAKLFSAEPDVQNPIAATIDARGRVWVAENYTYAERAQRFDLNLRDRVVVLEDLDGDGTADKRTVFTDNVQMLTGIVVGQGGVWLMCPPQLLFVPDADSDLIPDGPPQVKLDGFTVARENYHNFANGLSWGPDSWLYGRCGASCAGEMGLPGQSSESRIPIRGGIWRYHPQRQVVEALTQGTTNPWGHDWNSVGELFYINTVNGHLWHAIPGAHFVRAHTLDANPHSYELIDTHADHWHFDTGKSWTASRDGAANDFGGGHAHIGAMIYQHTNWPQEYRERLLTVNMHGRRINTERLEKAGSGYVGRHESDLLLSADKWFRGMEILPTPDGNALLIDWSDTGECHEANGVHRTSGRIFKIIYGASSNSTVFQDAKVAADPVALSLLQQNGSEWDARRARELLRTQHLIQDKNFTQTIEALFQLLTQSSQPQYQLRALFALRAIEAVDENQLMSLLEHDEPTLRGWAVRFLSDHWPLDTAVGQRPQSQQHNAPKPDILARLVTLAKIEKEASVRLILASTLQRLPVTQRSQLADALMQHAEDAHDHNLPLLVWYGLMPLGHANLEQLVELATTSKWATTRRLMARRIVERIEQAPDAINRLIVAAVESEDSSFQRDVLTGMSLGLAGRRKAQMPKDWSRLQALVEKTADQDMRSALYKLNVLFGDGVAIEELKRLTMDTTAGMEERTAALESLVDSHAEGLREICLKLLKQRYLNIVAANGLAAESDLTVAQELIKSFRSFAPLDRPQVVSILTTRAGWARALLQSVEAGQIDRSEITPYQARQIASHADPGLDELLTKHWGQVRETSQERVKQIAQLKAIMSPTNLSSANPAAGRHLFNKTCSSCHTLFGSGGKLGPDLTGSQRSNIDFLLENIVDPSAVVTKEFCATIVLLEDGRVLTGLLTSRSDEVITLATQEKSVQFAMEEVQEIRQSTASTMPEGLLAQLTPEQIRDLLAYLQSTQQITAN